MEFNAFLSPGERLIRSDDPAFQYTGRIDFDDPAAPVFVYPYSSVKMRFSGPSLKVLLNNRHAYWNNYLGFVIDGEQKKIQISEGTGVQCLTLAENLENREHELFFFKRQDSCHEILLYGFVVEKNAKVFPPEKRTGRKMEVFGDSVSAGEVSEAVEYVGKPDPEHNGEYSNSYYSYDAIASRKLGAELHNISQGGIALLSGTGWFRLPDTLGIEETWDKIEYNPDIGPSKPWDFSRYTPQVVLVAIGQNDNHPDDYMKEDESSDRSEKWRMHYEMFVRNIRRTYPSALIVLATTILEHDEGWDRSIERVKKRLNDPKVVHFLYSNNGRGTPGHIRIPEAERMAEELCTFLESFGERIWQR
ncbi:Cellulase/esterase CelE [Caprobacter fermentans]|uniref:Cellulase/esterase CelE n=1 Tax=Caproicibacter fermentans TaxID=2576756 RepID=A0A6N8I398_9FIRM|nr:GDSL-type esterase/lipase family protein [Caproicibacter fermentans]MVB12395.1 Cellulase/esterase CelE [Caproicibacter fermentans]